MRAIRRLNITTLVFLLSMPGISLAGNDAYKWTDANGITHYSERPPEGVNAERIKTRTGTKSKLDNSASPKAAPAEEKKVASSQQPIEALPNKDPEACKAAKANLELLNGYPRIRQKDAEGNYHFLTDEEKQQQRERAQKSIDFHC